VPERIVNLAAERGGWTLQTTARRARAAVVLGADGANSLVRRRVFEPFRRGQLSIATGFYAEGITSDTVVVDLVSDPPGYIWSFPRPDHLAIGICAQGDCGITSAQLRARARSWMDGRRIAQGAPLKPYAWPIPSLSAAAVAALPLAGPGWCLLGDAAGLVDPITREGIFYALQSADLAADAVLSDHSAPWARYALAVRRQIAPELARAARLKAGFFRPRFSGLLVEALARSTAVRAVMADLVSGRQPYGTLKRRLARTFEVRLAWQLLRLQAGEHLRRPPV